MQNFRLFAALVLISIAIVCPGYSHQPISASYNSERSPHPVYGAPPPAPQSLVPLTNQRPIQAKTHAPVVTALVRPIGSSGNNYEVQLSQPKQLNHDNRIPIPLSTTSAAAATNGPTSHYNGNFQFTNYAPQSTPYYQPINGVPGEHNGGGVAASNTPYTPHYNPLLAPQSSQPIPQPSLTPPPSTTFSHHGNHLQEHRFALSQPSAVSATQYQPISNSLNGVVGNYISQSEVGQLDHYFDKQNPVGDTRAYSRTVNTCYPDGHCEQQQLGSGQVDARHQQIILSARAHLQPISNKCRALAAQGSTQTIDSGLLNSSTSLQNPQNRPQNRRRYQYTEVVTPRDPFN